MPPPSTPGSQIEYRRRIGGTTWIPRVDVDPAGNQASVAGEMDPVDRGAGRRRKRRRRRVRFYRRKVFVFPMLLVLIAGAIAGAGAYRAQSTMNALHEVSEVPPQITDSTQSDDSVPVGLVFDTAPAKRVLEEAGLQPATGNDGVFDTFKDAASDAGDLASGAAVAAGVKDPSKDAITILVMGVDARPGAPIDIGVRPDALMVLYLNPTSGACRGLAIPRDSLVELPGYGQTKINHALMVAGIPYQTLVVEQFLNISVDHYALIDFTGFKELVDAVGGVSVNVPSDLKSGESILFAAGTQTFTGDQALTYARYRGADDVDVGRVRRQQQIIRGLVDVAASRNVAADVNELLPALADHVRTDLATDELIALVDQYRSYCSDSKLELDALQGDLYQPETLDPLYQQRLAYVRIEQAVIEEKVADLQRP